MILIDQQPSDGCEAVCVTLAPFKDYQHISICGYPIINIKFSPQLQSSSHFLYIIKNPLCQNGINLGEDILNFDLTIYSKCAEIRSSDSNSNSSFDDGDEQIYFYDIGMPQHQLNLENVSVPICEWCDNRTTTFNDVNPYDVSIIQPFNFGVRLDGKGNPVYNAVIQLNGTDRFDRRAGAYFNYVQPWQHHTHTPADGINVYSFALQPEQHQPSGTANLSRIDKTNLQITFQDPYRKNCHRFLPLSLSRNSRFYVYAFNYNILRVMSGMGGLAYSN
jgi:hypothetical protein